MLISIITPTYNSSNTIKDCLLSIYSQKNVSIEHIVIDGNSDDDTISIVKGTEFSNRVIISEPDEGIYDAMNKGIIQASGDIVGILNSDDIYSSNGTLKVITDYFDRFDVDCVFGDLEYVQANDTSKRLRLWKSNNFSLQDFKKGLHPAHPTFFVRREVYEKFGLFCLDFSIASDYEMMLRLLFKYKVKFCHIPQVLVKMRSGGASNRSLRNIIIANLECRRSWIKNDLKAPFLLLINKPIKKLSQFLER